MGKLISIGKILNFHGIKGEIKMGYSAGKESLIKSLKNIYVYINDEKVCYDVQSVRFHKNVAIIKFRQINSIDDVMLIKGLLVHVPEELLKANLKKDEFLIKDLINAKVFDTDGNEIGVISDVGENKASNILEIQKSNGLKFMVPFVKELVPEVDLNNNKIIINMIEGMDITAVTGDANEI